jgi:lysyl-tRNA synthetase class 2
MSDDWRPSATLEALRRRAQMLQRARAHFEREGVLEVETPVLSAAAVTDVHIESAGASLCGQQRFVHTSPEYAMKRLLAAGLGDCFQVTRVCRDHERGRWHHPEFTLLEWYRVDFELEQLMQDVERVIGACAAGIRPVAPARVITYGDALRTLAGVDAFSATAAQLRAALDSHGIDCPDTIDDRDELLDLLVGTVVAPQLGGDAPCFVTGYPASQAALARIDPGDPRTALRFELYIDGIEIANGFRELADAREQRARFDGDQRRREARGQTLRPVDERFLAALECGLPDCAGVALGFDRLVMWACGAARLDEVVAFPFERA